MRVSSIILLLICGCCSKSLPRSKAFQDFEQICEKDQSINGMSAFRHGEGAKGNDLEIMFTCRVIDPTGNLKVGQCSDKEEFDLFMNEDPTGNLIGSPKNCAEGEYLAGVKSTYVMEDSKEGPTRKMTFHCCAPENAKVDENIGCHHTESIDPLDTNRPFLMLKNKFFATEECPRDALSAVEVSGAGIAFKYCPYKVEGQSYNAKCSSSLKEGTEIFSETHGIAEAASVVSESTDLLKMVEQLPMLKIGEWTEFGKDFKIQCPTGEVVSSIDVKLDDVTRDVAMKCSCKPAQEEFESKHYITKITAMSYMELVSGFGDCDNKKEMVAGIVSQMDHSMRMMGLICVQQSNTVLEAPETPDVEKNVTKGVTILQPSQSDLKLIDFYIQRIPEIVAHARFAEVRGVEKAQFKETKEINEANKQAEIINDERKIKIDDYY